MRYVWSYLLFGLIVLNVLNGRVIDNPSLTLVTDIALVGVAILFIGLMIRRK